MFYSQHASETVVIQLTLSKANIFRTKFGARLREVSALETVLL